MPYRILKGTVSIDGKSPDGDTLAFHVKDAEDWIWPKTQDGRFPRFNVKYQANIRFEAIDALELHYTVNNIYPMITVKQPLGLAKQARDRLLELCGFDLSRVTENDQFRITDPDDQHKEVTLAYNGIDPYGRIIGFVFTEEMPFHVDDAHPTVYLYPEHVAKSVNAQLLKEGLVYPTYYGDLYPSLRDAFTDITHQARQQSIGIWKDNAAEFVLPRKPALAEIENIVMMPKLFRRLTTHIAKNGAISNFRNALSESDDVTVDTRDVRLSNFSSFVRTEKLDGGNYKVWLSHDPEELVFLKG
jgi:endonuclease YncB( thermonuclease family)